MTVLAWDGKIFAADKQSTCGNMKRTIKKIRKLDNGHLVGATGTSVDCKNYINWYEKVTEAEEGEYVAFPSWTGNNSPHMMVITQWKGVYLYTGTDTYLDYSENDIFATGSGAEYALGAMRAGSTAEKAVLIANEFDNHCGMGVDTLTLDSEEDTVKITLTADEAKKVIKKKSKTKVLDNA